jgi:hypothetical protein
LSRPVITCSSGYVRLGQNIDSCGVYRSVDGRIERVSGITGAGGAYAVNTTGKRDPEGAHAI